MTKVNILKVGQFQTQIVLFVLLLINRVVAAYALSFVVDRPAYLEFIRIGTDISTISYVLFVVSANLYDSRSLKYQGMGFWACLTALSVLYIVTYFCFVLGNGTENIPLKATFITLSVITGGFGLLISCAAVIHAEIVHANIGST